MGKYSLLFSPPPSRQPPAIESNFISAFLRCHYVFRWYFTTRMNFFLSLQQYILLSTSHVLLKWHSRFLWRRQREIRNLYARDTATASWTLRWGGSRWHREHGKRRNLIEKLLQFFTRLCVLAPLSGSTRRRKVKRSICNLMTTKKKYKNSHRLWGIWEFSRIPPHCLDTTQTCCGSGTCFGITHPIWLEVQQSRISIIESISRSPIIGENPEA